MPMNVRKLRISPLTSFFILIFNFPLFPTELQKPAWLAAVPAGPTWIITTDLWGLTAGKLDHSGNRQAVSVTMAIRRSGPRQGPARSHSSCARATAASATTRPTSRPFATASWSATATAPCTWWMPGSCCSTWCTAAPRGPGGWPAARMPVQVTLARLVHTTPPTRDKTTAQTIARRRMMDEQQHAFIDGRGKTGSQPI